MYYRLNGAVWVVRVEVFREWGKLIGETTQAYIMPQAASVDIDSELDLAIAECLLSRE